MAHPPDCPGNGRKGWDYEDYNGWRALLKTRCATILHRLRLGEIDGVDLSRNSRPCHRSMFHDLTPPDMPYFAGNYRGSAYRCLRFYAVHVPQNPRVGAPPENVEFLMSELDALVQESFHSLDHAHAIPDRDLPPPEKLYYAATVACRLLEAFLTVHPYANGNGHVARTIVIAVLGRYGYWLNRWRIEPSPEKRQDPAKRMPYIAMIESWRSGNPDFCPIQLMRDVA